MRGSADPGIFIGLENYFSLFDDDVFWLSVFNTLIYTIVATIAKFGLGMWLALLLNHAIPFKAFIRAIVLLPYIVPTVLSAIAFWWIYDPQFSIVSWSLHRLGLIDTFHRFPRHSLECTLVGDHCQCLARHSLRRHLPAWRVADDLAVALRGGSARWCRASGNASATSPCPC